METGRREAGTRVVLRSGGRNASVFGGWTQESTGGGDDAVLYLFDRLLGTNAKQNDVHKEIPDQRPFTWELVKERMAALGLDDFAKADERLHHALTRARAVNLVEEELPSLVALAELRLRQGNPC